MAYTDVNVLLCMYIDTRIAFYYALMKLNLEIFCFLDSWIPQLYLMVGTAIP
jgi:hypothetical protein